MNKLDELIAQAHEQEREIEDEHDAGFWNTMLDLAAKTPRPINEPTIECHECGKVMALRRAHWKRAWLNAKDGYTHARFALCDDCHAVWEGIETRQDKRRARRDRIQELDSMAQQAIGRNFVPAEPPMRLKEA